MTSKKTAHRETTAKPVYETPVVLPLGELVRGSGNCTNGSYPVGGGGNCKLGNVAGVNNCISGPTPKKNCNIGGTPFA